MSIEIVLQTASVAASVVGIAASLLTFFKAKRRASKSSKNSVFSVINDSKDTLDLLGITLAGSLNDKAISDSLRNKIQEGVRVRAILPDEEALESWAKSIDLSGEQLSLIRAQYEESLRRLYEYGVATRIIDHVAPNTIIASDRLVANKVNYTSSRTDSSPIFITHKDELIREYRHLFESLWQTSKEVITKPSSGHRR